MSNNKWREVCSAARRCKEKPSEFIRCAAEKRASAILKPTNGATVPAAEPQLAEVAS